MEEAFMLVLSRKQTQELRVGNDITITVLEVRGNVVRLGIQAPRDVRILRGELTEWTDQISDKRLELSVVS
jgi:carbon storage regulator CsrA